ncbi:hypothetical protein LTS15_002411 [Exophiala xenobiotica]|nr:hypothetical protein LTS15_002411 [Exophiala xenobiotica]
MGNLNETNSMEMREASKDSISSVDRTSDEAKSAGFQEKHVAKAYPTAAEGPKLRRLFSFAQLLAFSLTFMESWEVMAMYGFLGRRRSLALTLI